MEVITSKNNPKVVRDAKLLQRKYREEYGEYTVCGKKLVGEAANCELNAKRIFVTNAFLDKNQEFFTFVVNKIGKYAEIITVNDEILKKISGEDAPEGIICVFACIDKSEKTDKIYNNTLCDGIKGGIVILDSVRDPGNIGTVIRSAYAFGVGLVILSPDCADIYSPKVQRGGMGAVFSQSIKVMPVKRAIEELKQHGFCVYAAALHRNSTELQSIDINERTAFVIGNEGNGLSQDIIDTCSGSVIIPIQPHSESLNAAVAASVIMWEISKKFK